MKEGQELCVSAVMFKKSVFELVEQKDIYFARLSVDKPLFARLGGKTEAEEDEVEADNKKDSQSGNKSKNNAQDCFETYMQPYSTYNTATLVLLRHRASGLLLQCCAVYPNWDPTIEPVKVMSLRYAHSVIQE